MQIVEDNLVFSYIKLQYKLNNRNFKEIGVNPILAYLIFLSAFILISLVLFKKTEFAALSIVLISLFFTAKLSEKNRTDFLKIIFNKIDFSKIRIVENVLTSLPFLIFLIFKSCLWEALLLTILTILLPFYRFNTPLILTIPTPFSKRPFEFLVGFRKTFYLFPIVFILTYISIYVNNFNLGIFSMLLVFLICLSYYRTAENEYFVWSFKKSPQRFLYEKMKIAIWYSTFLVFPIVVVLSAFYPEKIIYVLIFLLIGFVFLISMIVAKYSVYPQNMGLPQEILLTSCVFFPPLLIIVFPILYGQSVERLKHLLR